MSTSGLFSPTGSAIISECGRYRYLLTRKLYTAGGKGRVTFIMLNPSTADANQDDPTIRRCMGFARGLGFDELAVVNLSAYRSTDPGNIDFTKPEFISAPHEHNGHYIFQACAKSGMCIAAWGCSKVPDELVFNSVEAACAGLRENGVGHIHVLGQTRSGAPRHPLYLPRNAAPIQWCVT